MEEAEEFDEPANGHYCAIQFFSDQGALSDELGVVIIHGDHPGSTYYAAELEIEVEEANRRAAEAGIEIRFIK